MQKIIFLIGIVVAGSHLQIEAMFARLTTQGAKVKPGQIAKQIPSQVIPKRDTTTSSPKKTDTDKESSTSSERPTQTQATQERATKAARERTSSSSSRESKRDQSGDKNAAPKRTIVAAIRDAIASGKQAMASAWNNLMNSFYNIPPAGDESFSSQVGWGTSKGPEKSATEENLISRGKPVEKKPFPFGGPQQSIQKGLYSTSTNVVEPAAVDSVRQSEAQRESEDIVRKLQGKNPWNYPRRVPLKGEPALEDPFEKQVEEFLEKNDANAIEEVVHQLLTDDASMHGQYLLTDMVKKNDAFALKVFPLVEKNTDKVINPFLLGVILLRLQPEQLLQAEKMIKTFFRGTPASWLVMSYKPESIAKLLPKDTIKFMGIMREICQKISREKFVDDKQKKRYDEFVSFFTKVFAEKFVHGTDEDLWILIQELCEANYFGEDLFKKLILSDSGLKNTLVDYIKRNIKQLSQTQQELYIIDSFISFDPVIKDFLIDYIKTEQKAMKQLLLSLTGQKLLEQLASDSVEVQKLIGDYLKKETDPNVKSSLSARYLLTVLDGPDFIEIALGIDSSYAQTPSYRHLVKFYQELNNLKVGSHHSDFLSIVKNNSDFEHNFKRMIQRIMQKEKELIDQGYEVFYHGRRWEHNFFSDIYMMLYSYKSEKELKDFIFLHYDDPVLGKVRESFFESEGKKRELLIAKGNEVPFTTKLEDALGIGRSTLFLAKYLFGNLSAPGCCPLHLMLTNFNWGKGDFSIQEIFSMFGYSDVYRMHAQKLAALQSQHNKLSLYGEIMQIAIPGDNLNKCLYQSQIGCHAQKHDLDIPEVGKTKDVKNSVDYVNKEPQDRLEFILTMTRDQYGGMSPESGIKVFSYNLVDSDKMAAFNKEEVKPEFAAIVKDLRQRDMQESIPLSENKEAVSENKEAVEAIQ